MSRVDDSSLNTLEAVLVEGDGETIVLIAGATRLELARAEIAWIGEAPPSGHPPSTHGVHVVVVLRGDPCFVSCRRLVPPETRVPFAVRTRANAALAVRSEGFRAAEQEYLAQFGLKPDDHGSRRR